jgi:hypothetical protein
MSPLKHLYSVQKWILVFLSNNEAIAAGENPEQAWESAHENVTAIKCRENRGLRPPEEDSRDG